MDEYYDKAVAPELDQIALPTRLITSVRVSTTKTESRHLEVEAHTLAKRWNVSLETANDT